MGEPGPGSRGADRGWMSPRMSLTAATIWGLLSPRSSEVKCRTETSAKATETDSPKRSGRAGVWWAWPVLPVAWNVLLSCLLPVPVSPLSLTGPSVHASVSLGTRVQKCLSDGVPCVHGRSCPAGSWPCQESPCVPPGWPCPASSLTRSPSRLPQAPVP